MSVYTKKSKRLRAVRGVCKADGCSSLVAERNGQHGRLPAYCLAHFPRRRKTDILRGSAPKPRAAVRDSVIEYVTIDEWKKRYGVPGSGGLPDQNGRYSGFFATEPCFCEDE